jgi:hypothetical protein
MIVLTVTFGENIGVIWEFAAAVLIVCVPMILAIMAFSLIKRLIDQ